MAVVAKCGCFLYLPPQFGFGLELILRGQMPGPSPSQSTVALDSFLPDRWQPS
jgi:hypothetical protein